MKKMFPILLGLAFLAAAFLFINQTLAKAEIEDFAIDFIETSFSDGARDGVEGQAMIADDSQAMKDLLAYKKILKDHSGIKDLYLADFTVEEIKTRSLSDGLYEVYVETMEENAEPGADPIQFRQNFYRIVLRDEGGQFKVVKAISDDFTSSTFFPEVMSNSEAFMDYDMDNFEADVRAIDMAKEIANTQERTAYFEKDQEAYREAQGEALAKGLG